MRKRAQWRGTPLPNEPGATESHVRPKETEVPKRHFSFKKNWWISIVLVGVFLLVLFMNTYYNVTSEVTVNPDGQGFEKYYLSGPDPYYNLRLIEGTYQTGKYPYYYSSDPLLNYPIGAEGGRAPLFNMMALGFSRVLVPFMPETEAISFSMQFLPALYGALLIFVVYFLGKELFNKKAALIAAMFIAIIPAHISSGHGSAFGLFDHDSFLLLLFFLTFLFLIKSFKEEDQKKSLLYAILSGVPLAGYTMVWVEADYIYSIIAVCVAVIILIDIIRNKIEPKVFRTILVAIWSGYLISAPVIAFTPNGFAADTIFYICVAITLVCVIYYLFGKLKLPWTISIPVILLVGAGGLVFFYLAKYFSLKGPILSPIMSLSDVIFGGIYSNKVSMTIAEANVSQISNTVMSLGPAIYWIAWIGFFFLCYRYYKSKRKEYLFIIVLFAADIYWCTVAGRFINEMVPLIALLAGWIVWFFIDWIDYKQMIRNIRSAGGGFHGLRRGIKIIHIVGILLVAFIVILPSAFVAFDAAIPSAIDPKTKLSIKNEMFGDSFQGAFGESVYKESYWSNALSWLNSQDINVSNPFKKPAFISWWDYGFYEAALGGHPTVADNFQDGIPPAANFETATSEKEAVAVWIVRLLEGVEDTNGKLAQNVIDVLTQHLGANNSANITHWMDDYKSSPSYGDPIGANYDNASSKKYTVGQQYPENAAYHDIVDLLNNTLTDEGITWLYHDLQDVTGNSIRYYGVEGYDKQIFNIFAFLSDKSLVLVNGVGDDFLDLEYVGYTQDSAGNRQNMTWTGQEIKAMSLAERSQIAVTSTQQVFKDPYFETMFYRTYIGPYQIDQTTGQKQEYDYQIPCNDMTHFYAEFISDIYHYPYYDTGKASVVIAKYYEGAFVNGTVYFNGEPIDALAVAQKDLVYSSANNISLPIDHDSAVTSNGNFSLLIGAGAQVQIRRNYGTNVRPFVMQNISFDGNGSLAPITDDEAMRKPGSNYERNLNITIKPASVEGFIYNDKDNDEIYNVTTDSATSNVNLTLYEIQGFNDQGFIPGSPILVNVSQTGHYSTSGLLPGYYLVRAEQNGFIINETVIALYENENYVNMSETKHSSVNGKVYYNEESNVIGGANVELTYKRTDIYNNIEKEIVVANTTTDSNGRYSFTDLVSGDYNITVTKLDPNTNRELYSAVEEVTLSQNETLSQNISLELVPVNTTGYTRYSGQAIGGIDVVFTPDASDVNNTAAQDQVTTDASGHYQINLTPGTYVVSVAKTLQNVLVYSFSGNLVLTPAQGTKSYDISMTKNSSTVSGYTTYSSVNAPNVSTIIFAPNTAVADNTAIYTVTTSSNSTGYYVAELSPGSYNVSVSYDFNESGQNYTYTYNANIEANSVAPMTYNIAMTRESRT